jgi:cobalt/nickel transport protein
LWKPPSDEVESLLFSLQAALGAGFLGYVIGRRQSTSLASSRDNVAGR